jgi:hypothetical protein
MHPHRLHSNHLLGIQRENEVAYRCAQIAEISRFPISEPSLGPAGG